MTNTMSNQKGMSLLETTLGILILSMGFLGMMPMMTTATANTLQSDYHVTATFLANQKMEGIIADKEFKGYSFVTNANYPGTSTTLSGTAYTTTVNAFEVNTTNLSTAQANTGYKRVEVTVSWGTSGTQDMTMTTLLTNY